MVVVSITPAQLDESSADTTVQKTTHNAAASLGVEQVSDWIARMELTDPDMLRAVPCHLVLDRCGQILRKREKAAFSMSKSVKRIGSFVSHSWQSSMHRKILLLMLLHNGAAAACVGTLAASVTMLLASLDYLPGYMRHHAASNQEFKYSLWCQAAGLLAATATFFLWRPQQSLFVDFVCINQLNTETKTLGVLNLGAILKKSRKMLVLYDSTFSDRLWCMFEMAAFMKSHEDTPTECLVIRPLFLANCLLGMFLCFVFTGVLNATDLRSPVSLSVYVVSMCLPPSFFIYQIKTYANTVESMRAELQCFAMQKARCSCCDSGCCQETGLCDREILTRCVQQWFGSVEEFDAVVRSRVASALQSRLGQLPLTYRMVLFASIPYVWAKMDAIFGILMKGAMREAASATLQGLTWWLLLIPMLFTACIDIAHVLRYRRCTRIVDSLIIGLTFSLVAFTGLGCTALHQMMPLVIDNPVLSSATSLGVALSLAILYYCLRPMIKDRRL